MAPVHLPVGPAPQPAPSGDEATYPDGELRPARQLNEERLIRATPVRPSGDEAKVRETTPELRAVIERVLMLVSLGEPCDFRARLTEAFNLGARDERGACEKLIRARANVAFVITDLAAPRVRKALHNIADVIARRGSEGT